MLDQCLDIFRKYPLDCFSLIHGETKEVSFVLSQPNVDCQENLKWKIATIFYLKKKKKVSVIAFSAPPEFDEVVTTTTCSEVAELTFPSPLFLSFLPFSTKGEILQKKNLQFFF